MKLWLINSNANWFRKGEIENFTLSDIINRINKYGLADDFLMLPMKQLKDIFPVLEPSFDVDDYDQLIDSNNRLISAFKNSRWIKLGRKLGFLKGVLDE